MWCVCTKMEMVANTKKRRVFAPEIAKRRSTRSMTAPIGIAKKSQGNITVPLRIEIRTGLCVRVMASNGSTVQARPSARLEAIEADHILLKAGVSPIFPVRGVLTLTLQMESARHPSLHCRCFYCHAIEECRRSESYVLMCEAQPVPTPPGESRDARHVHP